MEIASNHSLIPYHHQNYEILPVRQSEPILRASRRNGFINEDKSDRLYKYFGETDAHAGIYNTKRRAVPLETGPIGTLIDIYT